MAKPSDYRAIALWGNQLGSYAYYVELEQNLASRENAPLDALFQRDEKWVCVSDLKPDHWFHAMFAQSEAQLNKA